MVGVASVVLALVGAAGHAVLEPPEVLGFFALLLGPGALAALLSRGGSRRGDFVAAAVAASFTVGVVFGIGNERGNFDNNAGVVLVGTTIVMSVVALVGAVFVKVLLRAGHVVVVLSRGAQAQDGIRQGDYDPVQWEPPDKP